MSNRSNEKKFDLLKSDPDFFNYMVLKVNEEHKLEDELDKKEFNKEKIIEKIDLLKVILDSVSGGVNVSSRIDPILKPSNIKTTSYISKGQVNMCLSLLTFATISPLECYPCVDYVEDFLEIQLSDGGFGIEKAIDLGKALTQKTVTSSYDRPEKPTEGMKDKET